MCRFTMFKGKQAILLANLILRPQHSIIKQSYNCLERQTDFMKNLNGDGFGVGWYDDEDGIAVDAPPPPEPHADADVDATETQLGLARWTRREDERDVAKRRRVQSAEQALTCEQAVLRSRSDPCVFTSITPAWNNINLQRLSEKIRSATIFAHVRAATPGLQTSQSNCHPFMYKQFMFMHNGAVAEFAAIKRNLLFGLRQKFFSALLGSTDSELCFYLILNELEDVLAEQSGASTAELYKRAIVRAIGRLVRAIEAVQAERACGAGGAEGGLCGEAGVSMLNFCFTDGDICCATKFVHPATHAPASLYYASGSEFAPSVRDLESAADADGGRQFRMLQHDKRQMCHIVSSEPLTTDVDDWISVPTNTILTVNERANLILEPIEY